MMLTQSGQSAASSKCLKLKRSKNAQKSKKQNLKLASSIHFTPFEIKMKKKIFNLLILFNKFLLILIAILTTVIKLILILFKQIIYVLFTCIFYIVQAISDIIKNECIICCPQVIFILRKIFCINNKNVLGKSTEFTVVLDLDNTLVDTHFQINSHIKVKPLEIYDRENKLIYYVYKRPYLNEFLNTISKIGRVVIFTASEQDYADKVIDEIDHHKCIQRRFYRESCLYNGTSFIKYLKSIGCNMSKTVVIDDNPITYSHNIRNAIPIKKFTV